MIERVRDALERKGYLVSECPGFYSFDLIAKKESTLLFVKATSNIDSLPEAQGEDLKSLMKDLGAHALVVGERTKSGDMQDGVVYERHGIPVINMATFERLEKKPPLVRAQRGGYYVEIDGCQIRERRESLGYSLSHFARKVGVCRRTIVDCESGKTTTVENAIMIEKELDSPVAKRIDLFSFREAEPELDMPKFDGSVVSKLSAMGFQVAYAKKSPFNIIADEESGKIIGALHKENEERTSNLLSRLSELVQASPAFILKSHSKKEIRGIPVVSEKELKKTSTPEELIEKIVL